MRVRAALDGDLLGAAEARIASWRGAFTGLVPQKFLDAMDAEAIAAAWRESVAAGRSRLYVAETGGEDGRRIVGYAGVGPERDGSQAGELYALFVHPDAWGTGVATALADAAVDDLRAGGYERVNLWVLEANGRARAFYRRYGFTETTDRTHSSLNNLPELRLTKGLATS
ncbi:GNAT family N-acetyltransferase [Kribbella sp. NPDC051770]|uniref:GNAT family N-acetyltransferase n=1 Tax=Kribbella sp. NPDC051770 TaxID=3155413 RepID=UPI00341305ED